MLEFRFPEMIFDLDLARDYFRDIRTGGLGLSLNVTRELDALTRSLTMIEVDYLKFSEALLRKEEARWEACLDQARERDIRVIVSRVEHPDLLGQLWARGIDYVQGNFIQPPQARLDFDFSGAVLE